MSDNPKHKRMTAKRTMQAHLAWVIFILSGEYQCPPDSVRSINTLTFGWWYEWSRTNQATPVSYINQNDGGPANIYGDYGPNIYRLANGKKWYLNNHNTFTQVNMLYLGDRLKLLQDKLELQAGVRLAMVSRKVNSYVPNIVQNRGQNVFEPLPQFSASYTFNSHHQLYLRGSIRPGGRLPLACAAACLAAFASDTAALMVTGCLALVLAFPERQKASAGCLRALLFAAACSPGTVHGAEWMAIVAALVCAAGAGRRQPDFAVAPMLESGCGLLLLCRILLRSDSVITPAMTATLIAGGMMLAFVRVFSTLTTRKGSSANVGPAGLPAALSITSLGLLFLAGASGSALTAHAAAGTLVLGLVTLWPVAIAFLRTGGLIDL